MSRTYTVQRGDWWRKISLIHYGDSEKFQQIINANPQMAGRKKADDGTPYLYTGDLVIIPDDVSDLKTEIPESIQNVNDNAISILIDGKLFSFFTSYEMTFSIDSIDTFSFSAPFDSSSLLYREAFRPFSYKPVSIYYGQQLILTGVLLAPQSEANPDSKTLTITGYSKPGILNDCMMPITSFPLEFNNQSLQQITNKVCQPYGIKNQFISSSGNIFEKVAIEIENRVLEFLIPLAKQRGLLTTNDEYGKLIFWKSESGSPVANFKQGELPFISCSPNFDYQNFYSHITAISKTTELEDSAQKTYINNYLVNRGINRHYNYKEEDVTSSELQQAVKEKAGRMFGESASYSLTVQGHKDKNGNLYKKNTIITLLAKDAMIYRESNFLIKGLTMSRSSDGGDITNFDLVLPGAYTGEIPEVFPWEEN